MVDAGARGKNGLVARTRHERVVADSTDADS